jgi:hypothetical protein
MQVAEPPSMHLSASGRSGLGEDPNGIAGCSLGSSVAGGHRRDHECVRSRALNVDGAARCASD